MASSMLRCGLNRVLQEIGELSGVDGIVHAGWGPFVGRVWSLPREQGGGPVWSGKDVNPEGKGDSRHRRGKATVANWGPSSACQWKTSR